MRLPAQKQKSVTVAARLPCGTLGVKRNFLSSPWNRITSEPCRPSPPWKAVSVTVAARLQCCAPSTRRNIQYIRRKIIACWLCHASPPPWKEYLFRTSVRSWPSSGIQGGSTSAFWTDCFQRCGGLAGGWESDEYSGRLTGLRSIQLKQIAGCSGVDTPLQPALL